MSLAAWLTFLVLVPTMLMIAGHKFNASQSLQFIASLTFGLLIATSYTFLILQYAVIRVWYPTFWTAAVDPHSELRGVIGSARVFVFLASLVPLLAAISLIVAGPGSSGYTLFRIVGVSLIVLGGIGFLFSIRLFQLIQQTYQALLAPA